VIRKILLAGVAALGLAASAHAQMMGPSPAGGDRATMDFIGKASASDEFEREAGAMARRHAHSSQVKSFAAEMVSAHTQTTQGLKMAIRKAHMPAPPPPRLNGDQQRMLGQLRSDQGPGFDRTYIDQQVQAHQDALQLMSGYAQGGPPGPIREAAKKTAPLVQHHLDMAKALQARTGH
jgi:putative membrane protein